MRNLLNISRGLKRGLLGPGSGWLVLLEDNVGAQIMKGRGEEREGRSKGGWSS